MSSKNKTPTQIIDTLLSTKELDRLLLENADEALFFYSIEGTLIYVNSAFEKITGYTRQELYERNFIPNIHPEDEEWTMKLWEGLFRGEFFENAEFRIIRKNGEIRWSQSSWKMVLDDNGEEIGIQGKQQDITKQKLIDLERSKLEKQLFQSKKMEAVGQLAGGIAHDINNMLAVILGHAELSLLEAKDSSIIASRIRNIIKASEHSAELVRHLLTFASQQTINPQVLNLNTSIATMLGMLSQLIGDYIQISFEQEASLWPVKVDAIQIDQIIVNLCLNAKDAIENSGEINIKTANYSVDENSDFINKSSFILPSGDYVRTSISDNGCGMSDTDLERAFEPFFTTKALGKGTGLGLSIIFGAVKQNGGFIEIQSELDVGTTVNVYFLRDINGEC